jgi:hypothetical protein
MRVPTLRLMFYAVTVSVHGDVAVGARGGAEKAAGRPAAMRQEGHVDMSPLALNGAIYKFKAPGS